MEWEHVKTRAKSDLDPQPSWQRGFGSRDFVARAYGENDGKRLLGTATAESEGV